MQILNSATMVAFLVGIGYARPAAALSKRTDSFPYFVKATTGDTSLPISDNPWQAVNGLYYILGVPSTPSTYCPDTVANCPVGNFTTYLPNGVLATEVPGGQLNWVSPTGTVGFTAAHSDATPPGSWVGGFDMQPILNSTYPNPNGVMTTPAFNASGFLACPASTVAGWQVFANISSLKLPANTTIDECYSFQATAFNYTGPLPAAWEYL